MGNALMAAAGEAGIRITLLDTCYLKGGFDRELEGVQRRFGDGSAEAWAERAGALKGGPLALVGAAIHSVRAVDPPSIGQVAAFASGSRHSGARSCVRAACGERGLSCDLRVHTHPAPFRQRSSRT